MRMNIIINNWDSFGLVNFFSLISGSRPLCSGASPKILLSDLKFVDLDICSPKTSKTNFLFTKMFEVLISYYHQLDSLYHIYFCPPYLFRQKLLWICLVLPDIGKKLKIDTIKIIPGF